MCAWKLLETGIDKFLKAVEARNVVSAEDLARELSVSVETIESWAKILAKEGIVKTSYDARGNLWVSVTAKNKAEKEKVAVDLHSNVYSELSEIEKLVKDREGILLEEAKKLKSFESVLQKDIDLIKNLDSEVEKLQERALEIKKTFSAIMGEKKKTVAESKKISSIVDSKIKKIDEIEKHIERFEERKKDLEKHADLVKALVAAIKKPLPDYDSKSKEVDSRMLDVRELTNKLSRKYKKIQKLFKKL